MRFLLLVLALAIPALPAAVGRDALLAEAVEKWLGERDHWAFTQRAIEYDGDRPRERLERYDPSRPGDHRWTLLAINGRAPTPEEHAAWAKKKFKKKRRRFDSPIGDYFDFPRARLVSQNAETARYEVPLRNDKKWLFESDKVRVTVTVNKQTRALERLSADVREPLKVLLGIARITDGALDLTFDEQEGAGPEGATPTGSVRVSVTRFGERAEFAWTDFKRVTPHPVNVADTRDRSAN